MRHLLKFGDSNIELFVYGNGPKKLLAFHGFDNEAQEFEPLAELLPGYTVIAVNLYFHGNSFASAEHVDAGLTIYDFKKLHEAIFEKFPAEQYEILGYSLGGRIALVLFQTLPDRVSRLILLAPDGLKSTFFYRFVTRNYFGKKIFNRTIKDPSRVLSIATFLTSIRVLPKKKLQFLHYNLEHQMRRDKVNNAWMIYRFIIPDLQKVKEIIVEQKKQVFIFLGKWDILMPPILGRRFKRGIENNCTVTIIDTGHHLLSVKNLTEISDVLKAEK